MLRTSVVSDGLCKLSGVLGDTVFLDEIQNFSTLYKDKIKVLIAEPSIGTMDYRSHECAWDLAFDLAKFEKESNYKFFKCTIGRLMVAYAREKFAEYAVAVGFDYIFYIDDDHSYTPDIFRKLEKHIKDYDIVAPLCVQRATPFYPVIYLSEVRKEIIDGQEVQTWNNEKYVDRKPLKKGDLVTDADAIGFGVTIIKVDLLRRIQKPWFFSMAPIGEDILFCMKAKEITKLNPEGCKIIVDTNVEAPHLKEGEYASWSDYEKNKPNNAVSSEPKNEGGSTAIGTD